MVSVVRFTIMMIIVTVARAILTMRNRVNLMITLMWYGFVGPDDYSLFRDFHGLGDCGAGCVSQGYAGVVLYGYGAGGSDSYENGVAL